MSALRDPAAARELAAAAFDLWQEGHLTEAEERYRAAIACLGAHDPGAADVHGEYASVLVALHRFAEAALQYERSLQLERQATKDESDPALVKARYLLGEHYLRTGEADSARRVVAPSLEASDRPLAWIVEAEALYLSGSFEEARAAGDRALALALDAAQRERIRERLAPLWETGG